MLGVLVKGGLDDGRGKARVNLFRHKHEMESGRTSSVGMEIMGFDTLGDIVASNVPGRKLSWEEIGKRSVGQQSIRRKFKLIIATGKSHQLHRSSWSRTLPSHHCIRSVEQQPQLLPTYGSSQQRVDRNEQVSQ